MVSKKKLRDPHAERESRKYDNPIYSREFLTDFLKKRGAPATLETLISELDVTADDAREALRRRLIAMCRDGQLVCNRRGAYLPISEADLIPGRVQGHRDGFGFVIPDDGGEDLFLSARQMRQVFHGDRVLVRVDGVDDRGRREGVIVEVTEHNTHQVVGRLFREGGVAFVAPENTRHSQEILVADDDCLGSWHGQYVTVEIVRQPTLRTKPTGRVVEVLGDHMAPGMEIAVAIRSYDIPHIWPPAVDRQAAEISDVVGESDKNGRVDLRDLPLVTIDGEDARDFDDAVYCEARPRGGWRLVVAIADVAHYVRPGTPLDEEAVNRGNSVYFPDHVVPMLPEKLSNGLCSLNPEVDRLCMVCDMTISSQGRISGYSFYEGVMHSHARLTYNKVSQMLEHPDSDVGRELREQYSGVVPRLEALYGLYKTLRDARQERGAIDFETTETRIIFTTGRKIDEVVPIQRNDAHKLIEECMLCANVATARFLKHHKLPALYRVHEGPSKEKLAGLRQFLAELGLQLPGGDEPEPMDYQSLLSSIKERPDAHVIQTVMLRSLSQAVYSPEEKGHFGLGYASYAHFTSPIRRYPDLTVHRAIKSVIHAGGDTDKTVRRPKKRSAELARYPYDFARMVQLGEQCSMTERRADDATRDVMAWLKCEFLQQHVGESYAGVISAVTAFGFFVELQGVYTEGLVHISSLQGDYYHFDKVKHRLVGERSGTSFRLGEEVSVRVMRVDLEDRKIDLELLGAPKRRRDRDGGRKSGSSAAKRLAELAPRGDKGGKGAKRPAKAAGAGKPRKRKNKTGSKAPTGGAAPAGNESAKSGKARGKRR
ncbi:ribonuclease R [Mangrovitalea sediminis]|uniref:ribonuclease R n=1 Tax=Mangrovitalea sediminis TaxID=1982043 RepID=UPI000BE55093|nr:ribonuclease R [Mangrovitalea sediminis]